MKITVTGASGFLGRALCARLVRDGHTVHALTRQSSPELEALGLTVFPGGVGDPRAIWAAAEGCERLVHTAAVTSHRASARALGWVNVAGTENVLRASRRAKVKRVVHVSCTDVTMTNVPRVNWNEDKGLIGDPLDSYGRTKLEAEEMVIGRGDDAMETTVVRPAMLWGAGDTTTLPGLLREALNEGGVRLFGKGDNLVATAHIGNVVDALARALTCETAAGAVYNITDNEFNLAAEFYSELSAAAGVSSPRVGGRYRFAYARAVLRKRRGEAGLWPSDVVRRGQSTSFDQQRAINDLGYDAPVTRDVGMAELSDWIASEGGAEAIASRVRPPATDEDIAEQVASAEATAT